MDNGEWVYGHYSEASPGYHVIINLSGAVWQVDPETVGQFTGLHDKNGREIWEGDIVALDDVKVSITFEDGAFQMIADKRRGASGAIQQRLKYFEVIGNIHDNPELLK